MKYAKLAALVLLAWVITYAGGAVLSLRAASPVAGSVATALLEHNILPNLLQPKTYAYTYNGKKFAAIGANLDAYQANEAGKGLLDLAGDEHSGGFVLYLWCAKALPWVSLLLTLWFLNLVAGIRRLADALD